MAHVQPVCSSGSVCKPKLLGRKTVRRNTIVQSLRCAQTRGTRVRSLCTICKAGSNSNGGSATAEEVLIVGAGIAGLSCGLRLRKAGIPFSILEASDGVGGRVRSDKVDGFILDRGFQIFLTSYPEAQAALDYTKLDLQPFYAGAMVQYKQKFHRVADPLRHPVDGVLSLFNDAGTVGDKVNVGAVRFKTLLGSLDRVLQRNETTTLDRLKVQ